MQPEYKVRYPNYNKKHKSTLLNSKITIKFYLIGNPAALACHKRRPTWFINLNMNKTLTCKNGLVFR